MSTGAWENLSKIWNKELKTLVLCPVFEQSCDYLKECKELVVYTPLKDQIEKFKNLNIATLSTFPSLSFEQVFFVPTKNKKESLAHLALSLDLLEESGDLFFACDNEFGAKGYMSLLKSLIGEIEFESKRKARFAKIKKSLLQNDYYKEWSQDFIFQENEAGFITFPGIYGWSKVDHASRLLVSTLPELKGIGADFGSGYGYISTQLDLASIKELHLFENDWRSLECAKRNLAGHGQAHFHWTDIANDRLDVPPLDFIVMNPPFHEGHDLKTDLGLSFIKKARECLKKEGRLFLVANQFLSYEDVLMESFGRMTKVLKQDGFKVIHV